MTLGILVISRNFHSFFHSVVPSRREKRVKHGGNFGEISVWNHEKSNVHILY